MLILAPFAAMLIQLAVSRSREYEADATGAISPAIRMRWPAHWQSSTPTRAASPWSARPRPRILFIIQPFLGMNFGSLFSTHPPIAKRIERLTGRPAEFTQ